MWHLGRLGLLTLWLLCVACVHTPVAPTQLAHHPVQAANDGWAALEGPVTGGNSANSEHTTVHTRAELVKALKRGGDLAKIIYIKGRIDLSVNHNNESVGEEYYRDPAFNWSAFEAAYDPSTWGKKNPEGALEDARKRSQERQAATVIVPVGSNTSLIGLGKDAALINGGLMLKDVHNIVIHNVNFEDAYDFFPSWDPNDNTHGEWNSLYDNITIHNSRRIWISHCRFSDGARPDHLNRTALGRKMQFHDGLIDIIRQSDLITLSHNHFKDHDKAMLIGNGDRRTEDAGRLRVTLHHNWFQNIKERAPRVRYGRVHVVNNLYTADPLADYPYGYSIGVGVGSQLVTEDNLFLLNNPKARVFKYWRGEHLSATRNYLEGQEINAQAMLLKENPKASMLSVDWQVRLTPEKTELHLLAEKIKKSAGTKTHP